jgi:hypothetical protein
VIMKTETNPGGATKTTFTAQTVDELGDEPA